MAYKLISGRPLAREVTRLLDEEAIAATTRLTQPPAVADIHQVYEARTHIKKMRTLLRLLSGTVGKRYFEADDELRMANRALGPVADAHRVQDTLAAIRGDGGLPLPVATLSAASSQLQARATAVETDAAAADVRSRTVRLLKSLRLEVVSAGWPMLDRAAIVTDIREAHAAARHARRVAMRRPSVDSFHRWRRRVKHEWYLLRLVSELTGDRLRDERHQLAALAACLGELHDVDVLMRTLTPRPPLSRLQLAGLIRLLRARAHDLRHRAHRLSSLLDERPRRLARRVRLLWGAVPRRRVAATARPWAHSA